MGAQGQQPAAVMSSCPHAVIACDKCKAFAHGEQSDEAIHALAYADSWIASRGLSSGAHSRDPVAHEDGGEIHDSSGNSPCRAALAEPRRRDGESLAALASAFFPMTTQSFIDETL
jgi:hypothetical protein